MNNWHRWWLAGTGAIFACAWASDKWPTLSWPSIGGSVLIVAALASYRGGA